GLAFYCLMAVPLAGAMFFTLRGARARLAGDVLVLAMLGTTVLTVTRSAILAIVPALALVAIRSGAVWPALGLIAQVGLVLGWVATRLGLTRALLGEIFSLKEGSTQGHLTGLSTSLALVRAEPFGRGLGTAGQIAQRFAPIEGVTNESWYFQIATEMG